MSNTAATATNANLLGNRLLLLLLAGLGGMRGGRGSSLITGKSVHTNKKV
jgi:hypothetical protein